MFYKYYNFRIERQKDFVEFMADTLCVMENVYDENREVKGSPEFIKKIIHNKLSFSNYDKYNIFVLPVAYHNVVTDHKKIWGLCDIEQKRIYDGYYDVDDYRIYFGLCEDSPLYTLWSKVILYVPKLGNIFADKIFDIFKTNRLGVECDKQVLLESLSYLQKIVPDSIVIYEFPNNMDVCIWGRDVENLFDVNVLPTTDIVEK